MGGRSCRHASITARTVAGRTIGTSTSVMRTASRSGRCAASSPTHSEDNCPRAGSSLRYHARHHRHAIMLERFDDRVVDGTGDDHDLIDSGGEKCARETGNKWPAVAIGEKRLGTTHARRSTCCEHDRREH